MLSEDEKKAIERLSSIDETVEEYDGNILKADIKIVANLITKLQKENETKIKGFENEELICSKFTEKVGKDIIDYKFEYENNQKIIDELQKENKEKDKQIDLTTEALSAVCTGISSVREQLEKSYCEFINNDKDCCWKTDKSCKDCIFEYFKKLAKEKNNIEK